MENFKLKNQISDILLEFASLYNEVTTSDLQGIADVEASKIIELVNNFKRLGGE